MGSSTATAIYHPSHDQQFEGQRKFLDALVFEYDLCEAVIRREGLHAGWKLICGIERHGNFNPNWKDQMWYLGFAFLNNQHFKKPCPALPLLNTEIDRRSQFLTQQAWWYHNWQACLLYERLAKQHRHLQKLGLSTVPPKRKRLITVDGEQQKVSQFSMEYPSVGCQPPTEDQLPDVEKLREKINKRIERAKKKTELEGLREVE